MCVCVQVLSQQEDRKEAMKNSVTKITARFGTQ